MRKLRLSLLFLLSTLTSSLFATLRMQPLFADGMVLQQRSQAPLWGEATPGAWSLYFNSVIVFGRVEFVTDYGEICRISRLLSLKFTDDEAYIAREIEKFGKNTALFALVPEHITGKRVHEE